MKNEFSREIIEKYSKRKFHEYPSSGRRAVPCGQVDRWTGGQVGGQVDRWAGGQMGGQVDRTKLLAI